MDESPSLIPVLSLPIHPHNKLPRNSPNHKEGTSKKQEHFSPMKQFASPQAGEAGLASAKSDEGAEVPFP